MTDKDKIQREKSREYWKNRFEALENRQHDRSKKRSMQIADNFDRATARIDQSITYWYQRIADNNNITLQEAKKLLDAKQLKEFKWSVEEYIQYGRENALNQKWMKELENASARAHISRLDAMKLQAEQQAQVVYASAEKELTEHLSDVYSDSSMRTAYELAVGTGVGEPFSQIDSKGLAKILNEPWCSDGKTFSKRIWEERDKLVANLDTQLTRMCITGASPDKVIKDITAAMGAKKSNVARLVMTESAYIASAAQRDCFSNLDVEQYEIVATLDGHTSTICQEMDGQVFSMREFEEGVTAPPFHPNCRSTTVPYFDDEFTYGEKRAARGGDGEYYEVPADMTYGEWKKGFVDGDVKDLKPAELLKIEKTSIENANNIATDAIVEQYNHRVNDLCVNYVPYSEFDDKMMGDSGADFTGMDAQLAESTAKQFKQLSSEYESMCQKIEVKKFDSMMGSVPASTEPAMNVQQAKMSFNKSIVGNRDKFMERMANAVERNQFPMMEESEYEQYMVTHEFAHTLMDFKSPLKNYVGAETSHIRNARKEIEKIRETYQERIRTLTVAQKEAEMDAITSFDEAEWTKAQKLSEELKHLTISKYADTSVDEFMAEAFTDAKIGSNPSEYSKQVLGVIDKYFKKTKFIGKNRNEQLKIDLQLFAKKHKTKKVPNDNPLWDSLVQGDVKKQKEEGIFEWSHGGYDYLIEYNDDYAYNILSRKKKPNIHEGNK